MTDFDSPSSTHLSQQREVHVCFAAFDVEFRVTFSSARQAVEARKYLGAAFRVIPQIEILARACLLSASSDEDWLQSLEHEMKWQLAYRSRKFLLLQAAVVGWKDRAIIITGRRNHGKSELVHAMLQQGASYYSDDFAVFDSEGRVLPWPGRLRLRDSVGDPVDIDIPGMEWPVGKNPIPAGFALALAFRPGRAWQAEVKQGVRAALPLIQATVLARAAPERTLALFSKIAPQLVTLVGTRPEAADSARWIRELLDSAGSVEELVVETQRKLGTAGETAAANLPRRSAEVTFCLIHLGEHPPPAHLVVAVDQLLLHNPGSTVYVVIETSNMAELERLLDESRIARSSVIAVSAESLPRTGLHASFLARQQLQDEFRDRFWRYTTERSWSFTR